MGFFDQISKKAAETMQTAKDKTSKISSEMKLKSQFSEKKNKINSLYAEIGKEVYSNFTKGIENTNETITIKCKEITGINDELKGINEELLKLSDMMVCTNCGEKIAANSEFCPKCGTKVVAISQTVPETAVETKVEEDNKE